MIAGLGVLLIAGLFQGSFGLGYKRYPPFSWAAFWGVYCLLCMVIAAGVAVLAVPQVLTSIQFPPLAILCGALWGLSAVCFSKAIGKIGMSMVYGISMGVSTIVGSVIPMLMDPDSKHGLFVALGLGITACGVAVITAAGIRRDGGFQRSSLGVLLAIVSGLGSGAMNVGFQLCAEAGETLLQMGYSQTAVSAVKWMPVLVGGCTMGLLWCVCELTAKKEWHTLTEAGALRRTGVLFGVSAVWYGALLLYGLAVLLLGSGYGAIGWILFNALALLVSVLWGMKTGEWAGKPKGLLAVGCALLVLAWIFISI